ncbi:MAG: hypothetical protein WDN07_02970 [Actinomycetota bacterium]
MSFTRTKSIAVAIVMATSGLVATTGSASSADTNSQALSSTVTSIPGVSVDASGTFHYTNTLSSPQDLSGAVTSVVQGTRNSSGACVFSDPNSVGPKFGTEIAYNPTTCQDTMLFGQLTSKGIADLAAISPASTPSPGTSTKLAGGAAQPSAALSPASYDGWQSAYNKVAFIDPINLTIVSLSNNFTWEISGSSVIYGNTTPSAYLEHFGGDVTTSTGFGTSYTNIGGAYGIQSTTWNSWTNSDFEAWMVFFLGAPGYAACGFNSSSSQFYIAPTVTGNSDTTFTHSDVHTKSGGCTDLIHTNYNSGYGTLN